MPEVVAINGSPMMGKGETAKILDPFLHGTEDGGAKTRLFYASRINPKPCAGEMSCWYRKPGECHIRDGMQELYTVLREADILILATPVYIPLPGMMQNLINRLCPLVEPQLRFEEGRTRAKTREGVRLRQMALVSTGAWWERQNFDTVEKIVEGLAKDLGVEFAGTVIRPHAFMLEKYPDVAKVIFEEVRLAGRQLAAEGRMAQELLDSISRPLLPEEELRQMWNQMNQVAIDRAMREG